MLEKENYVIQVFGCDLSSTKDCEQEVKQLEIWAELTRFQEVTSCTNLEANGWDYANF